MVGMGGGMGGGCMGGMYGRQPGGLSSDAYVDKTLRPMDAEHYSAAGLIPYRRREGRVELLLAREKPWNSFINAYDPLSWNVFGGKRVTNQERSSEVTAIRCFHEAVDKVADVPSQADLFAMMGGGFYLWYPMGKFALLFLEVEDGSFDDLPNKFATAKEANPNEEFRILPMGVKKWTKQIELLEWVPGADLYPDVKFVASDLLSNMLKVSRFQDFLTGKFVPAETWPKGSYPLPQPPEEGANGKGKGKSKGKGKGWYKGGGKGGKDKGGKDGMMMKGGYGKMGDVPPMYSGQKGMPMMQMPPPMPMYNAAAAPPTPFQAGSEEMQRQMYGEQLYVLVLPLSPSPYLAQKITGMLLELPTNELLLNLQDQEELTRRVKEALDVLKEDGIAS